MRPVHQVAGEEHGVGAVGEHAFTECGGNFPGLVVELEVPRLAEAVPQPAQGLWIEQRVADLADDRESFNAVEAIRELKRAGAAAVPALRVALVSPDAQQRQLAAHLLRLMYPEPPGADLLRVTCEGMRLDAVPWGRALDRRVMDISLAGEGTAFLLRHAEAAEAVLVEGLHAGDRRQSFLCAFVLGTAGLHAHRDAVVSRLLPHLGDNDVSGDAMMAGAALLRLGPSVAGPLAAARPRCDVQARAVIDLILRDLEDPPDTPAKLRARGRDPTVPRLSVMYHDAVYEYRYRARRHPELR